MPGIAALLARAEVSWSQESLWYGFMGLVLFSNTKAVATFCGDYWLGLSVSVTATLCMAVPYTLYTVQLRNYTVYEQCTK